MEGPSEKEYLAEKVYLAENYMAKDQENTIKDKTSKKEVKKEVTNEELMEKLNIIEYLIIEINQAQIQIKKDTTKMSEHINTIDSIMSKMPLNWLGGFGFKALK